MNIEIFATSNWSIVVDIEDKDLRWVGQFKNREYSTSRKQGTADKIQDYEKSSL